MLAFPVAVWSKFNDDQAGNLAALISYYAFAAIFPLLLILVTVLNIVLRNDPQLQQDLINSALAQYPVIGQQIKANLGSISWHRAAADHRHRLPAARRQGSGGRHAERDVRGVGHTEGAPTGLPAVYRLVARAGAQHRHRFRRDHVPFRPGRRAPGTCSPARARTSPRWPSRLVVNLGMFWLGFRLATFFQVRWRDLRTGAAIAAVCWQVLQVAGGYVVSHQLHRASELYGTFGIVLGLMAWLFLQSEVTLYAAEIDVVLARRQWPALHPARRR